MTESIPIFGALLVSMLHVLTGPDHLAAVTPFAIEARRKAWKVGLMWAIGHLIGMLLIGFLFLLFREAIPVDSISQYAEKLVGFVLIGVGLWSILKIIFKPKEHKHLHLHNGDQPFIHRHKHDHTEHTSHDHRHSGSEKGGIWSSLGIGLIHGVAGVSHILLFIPVLGFESGAESIQYIFGFGIGIVTAMLIYTVIIGKISGMAGYSHNDMFFNGIRLGGGLFAIAIGFYWIIIN